MHVCMHSDLHSSPNTLEKFYFIGLSAVSKQQDNSSAAIMPRWYSRKKGIFIIPHALNER